MTTAGLRVLIKDIQRRTPPKGREHLVFDERRRRWVLPSSQVSQAKTPRRFSQRGVFATNAADIERELSDFNEREAPSYRSVDHYDILDHYTGSHLYFSLNDYLRYGEVEGAAYSEAELKGYIRELTDLMEPMVEPQVVYRGTALVETPAGEAAQVGDIIPIDAFMSTSRSPRVADEFVRGGDMLEIETTPETRAITLSNYDTLHSEHETIIDWGQCFEVTAAQPLRGYGTSRLISGRIVECP